MSDRPLVLITGCAGFLGRHLMAALSEKDVDIIGIDKSPAAGYGRKDINVVTGDFLSDDGISAIKRELDKKKNKEACLVHLMGISDADKCEEDKSMAYEVNVKSAEFAWRLAEDFGMKKMVFSSTALVYGLKHEEPITEECPPFPENTYARTKVETENYLVSKSAGSKTSSVILRISNIYGPGMSENTVVATALKQLGAGHLKLKEYRSVRDYIYVEDVAGAFTAAIFSGCRFKIYNVGTAVGYSVWDMAKVVAEVIGKKDVIEGMGLNSEETGGGNMRVLSCGRINGDLGWKPKYDLRNGIKRTINA